MRISKIGLLAATAASSVFGGFAAQAQVAYNNTTYYGWGASLPANVVRQQLDCQGTKQLLGFRNDVSKSIDDFNYVPPSPTVANPAYDCQTKIVQPNITGWYLSTGSGRGVDGWKNYDLTQQNTNNLPGGNFPAIHFALSETPLSATNITQYNAGAKTTKATGNPIQIPFILSPVTIAYDPVYAKRRNAGGGIDSYAFNIKASFKRADGSGGLRLSKAAYCGIFNGTITNWNDPALKTLNGGTSLRDPADPTPDASWSVPIRLVGRSETSGTSSLWTRHLAKVCGGKYQNSENKLPYDGSVTVPLTGTAYNGTASTINPTNSIRGTGWNKATSAVVGTAEVPGDGKYTVADGSDGVAEYLDYHPNPSATVGDTVLNGKIGYLGPDFTLPATNFNLQNNFGLNTASLQIGTGTTYAAPTAATAIAAAGSGTTAIYLPPQSKPTGVYDTTATGSGGDRANPLDWVQAADKNVPLANPLKGYPIVGTTNMLLYTCYANADVRKAIVHFLGMEVGKVTKDSTGTTVASNIPAALFNQPAYGELAKNGLAPLPAAFKTAIFETFLKKSTQASPAGVANQLGLRNLWIQSNLPTTAATFNSAAANPGCTAGQGA